MNDLTKQLKIFFLWHIFPFIIGTDEFLKKYKYIIFLNSIWH